MTDEEYLARLGLLRLQSGKRKPQEPIPAGSSVLDVPIGGTKRIPDTVLRRQYEGPNIGEAIPYDPTLRERLAAKTQDVFEGLGADRYKARQRAETLIGGAGSNLPLGMGVADVVPFLGTTLQTQEAGRGLEQAGRDIQRGDYLSAGIEGLGAGLGLLPGLSATAKGAKAVGRRVREAADPEAIRQYVRQTQGLTGMPGTSVIKPKGGNWLTGDIEKQTERLKSELEPMNFDEMVERRGEQQAQEMLRAYQEAPHYKRESALNQWVDKKLNKYIRNEMGTVEDPVRKLAEQDILHFEPQQVFGDAPSTLMRKRAGAGMPTPLFGQSEMARRWESLADRAIDPFPAGSYKYGALDESLLASNPWLEKVPDEAMVYKAKGLQRDMGFDHLIDELRNAISPNSDLPAHLRWKPEDLDKVTMEQAVRRVHDINQYRMAKKAEANEALARNPATAPYKDYETVPGTTQPNEKGLTWKQIKQPGELPEGWVERGGNVAGPEGAIAIKGSVNDPRRKALEDALKYEGEVMGHCVGGYCDDVLSGKSQIFSLRDKKGEPHVTIEVRPATARSEPAEMQAIYDKVQAEADARNFATLEERDSFYFPRVGELQMQMLAEKAKALPPEIIQIKGKANRAPKEEYLPFVQDFVRSGNWSRVGDLKNTGLYRKGDFIDEFTSDQLDAVGKGEYLTLDEIKKLREGKTWKPIDTRPELNLPDDLLPPAQNYAAGGLVQNTDTMRDKLIAAGMDPEQAMMQALRMADQVEMAGGGLAKAAKSAIAELKGKYKALPLDLPRAPAMTPQQIEQTAERIARQQLGEHVRKPGDTKNLAGRSLKEAERLKKLSYSLESTKTPPLEKVVPEKKGQVRVALPGDISVADKTLVEVEGLPIGALQQGGPKYGAGKMDLPDPRFWASNVGPASNLQRKIDDLAMLYETPEVLAEHMAMGSTGMNFAQHLANANLMAINSSMPHPKAVEQFNKVIRKGFFDPVSKTQVEFPDFPGVENYKASYQALKEDPELRKWFNNRMKTEDVTAPLNFPSGKDIEYAISEPELRDLEIGMTGLSVGQMQPGASLIKQSAHKTYSHDIPGLYLGRTKELLPVELAFPDASTFIKSTKRPADFTGTMQKVFPHQLVDEQYINELGEYYDKLRKIRGFNEGGVVKPEGADDFAKQVMQKIANQQVSA